jgi:predicted nucleic acid-binding protein
MTPRSSPSWTTRPLRPGSTRCPGPPAELRTARPSPRSMALEATSDLSMTERLELVVVDASVLVDLLAGTEVASAARSRLAHAVLHAPAHLDAEVLSALGRLNRAGDLATADVEAALAHMAALPVTRHELPELVVGAWARRGDLRLLDALYVELAARLGVRVLTTDHRLARASPLAEAISGPS